MSFPNYRYRRPKTSTASIRAIQSVPWSSDYSVELDRCAPGFDGEPNDEYDSYFCKDETHAYLFAAFAALVLEDEGYAVELPA